MHLSSTSFVRAIYLRSGSALFHCRQFSSAAVASEQKVNKQDLMKLRKATGYSFLNCREALLKFGSDVVSAEKYLHELAQEQGWEKATKLSGRSARHGFIVAYCEGHVGCLLELNCQTDFVSSSEPFQSLAALLAKCNFSIFNQTFGAEPIDDKPAKIVNIDLEHLHNYKVSNDDSQTVSEFLALQTGKIGEKLVISRALGLVTEKDCNVFSYCHPKGITQSGVSMGQFSTLVALRSTSPREQIADCARDLGMHIIGMCPQSLGQPPEDTHTDTDSDQAKQDEHFIPNMLSANDETQLLRQPFITDQSITVHKYLAQRGLELLDFTRAECGEAIGEGQ